MAVDSQIELKSELVIEKPDITNKKAFGKWLDQYVQNPFISFADKKHEDGTPYSQEEQIE